VNLPLPALPDVVPAAEPAWVPTGRSIIEVLSEDHDQMLALADELDDDNTARSRRRQIVDVLVAMVSRHMAAERQYLYPAVKIVLAGGRELVGDEIAIEQALQRELAGVTHLERAAHLIRDHVRRHTGVAGQTLLPSVAAALSQEELVRLGNRVQVVQEEAPTRPHPHLPTSPPWNKIVDAGVGVLDKARDALTGRPTHPEDVVEG
jgi:hypothetical protein